MTENAMIPRSASIAIADMLENCAQLQPGQRVLILAHIDGLHGSDNLIDAEVVNWITAAVQERHAYPSVLWVDEPFEAYVWKMPKIAKAALAGADIMINNSFDITIEEIRELRDGLMSGNCVMVRNFATTTPLMTSAYAQTPHELVCQIRYQVGAMFEEGAPYTLSDANGTHLEGSIGAPLTVMPWTQWRNETSYRPFPEWVHPPVNINDSTGELIFDRSLSWWTRYVGLPPFFSKPVRATVEGGLIKRFEGGAEAETLTSFFKWLSNRYGQDVMKLSACHSGVHPNAVPPDQLANQTYRRLIEHQYTSNIHFHLGDILNNPDWPAQMLHLTGDIRQPTWKVGDEMVHVDGNLTALEHPEVQAIAAKYPDRPTLPKDAWSGF